MAKKALPAAHTLASNQYFDAWAEGWLIDNVSIEKALAVPGVAELLFEEFNNTIIEDFDDNYEGWPKEQLQA